MKKILVLALTAIMCAVNISGCGKSSVTQTKPEKYLGEKVKNVQLFPTLDTSFVGDPMPYYENGVFHVFYLEDLRDGTVGYHPWSLYETSNFYKYENKGQVIPFGKSMTDQDIALGTGSVIKDQKGVYHAFYTGHNDTYEPKEAIMHATSNDMVNWTKFPEDTFSAGENYSKNDFRDPYVLYVEKEKQYWMLVSTRNENSGILVKYTSKDLKTWSDEGVFFVNDMGTGSNMECSSLIQYQGKWYLSYSDQWPDRVFHYRVSDKLSGPFEIPKQDVIDGNGFYAGRLETDGKNLYTFGWNATKNHHLDSEDYNWAGNLVVHQLKQTKDGELRPIVNKQVKEKMNNQLNLTPVLLTDTIDMKESNYSFSGKKYETAEFNNILGSYRVEAQVKNFHNSEKFGFAFNTDENGVGSLNLVFDVKNNKIQFYNTDKLYQEDPQSEIAFDFTDVDELNISLLISDGVASMYVNDQCAMTARMYSSQGSKWGIFGINADFKCENLKIYK